MGFSLFYLTSLMKLSHFGNKLLLSKEIQNQRNSRHHIVFVVKKKMKVKDHLIAKYQNWKTANYTFL